MTCACARPRAKRTRVTEMTMKLKRALSVVAAVLSLTPLAAHSGDDSDDRRGGHHHRPRAADLKDCCTAGDQDFPKVGGNLGNQNYSRLKQIDRARLRKLGAVWLNKIE